VAQRTAEVAEEKPLVLPRTNSLSPEDHALLLSMTGFGEASCQRNGTSVVVEARSLNNRYLKLNIHISEGYAALEPRVETLVRRHIRRGMVRVNVNIERLALPEDFHINTAVIEGYRRQIETLQREWRLAETVPLATLLTLPGAVASRNARRGDAAADWPLVAETLESALAKLAAMRREEGLAMAEDMRNNCQAIAAGLAQIAERGPRVLVDSRSRLQERLQKTLAEYAVSLEPADLVREISLLAERMDISEEITRLQSHLQQFKEAMDLPESSGRKLEFLSQEMLREANTIGAKAPDVEIARHVIEIKTAIERIREMVQNVE
jgi:uncharacterized protein (TIGR00255 family)